MINAQLQNPIWKLGVGSWELVGVWPLAVGSWKLLQTSGKDQPDVRPAVPRSALVVAEDRPDVKAGGLETTGHLGHRERAERQRESMHPGPAPPALDVLLIEDREALRAILADRLDKRQTRGFAAGTGQAAAPMVFGPAREVGHQIDPEQPSTADHAGHRLQRRQQIPLARQRLQNAVRRHDERET